MIAGRAGGPHDGKRLSSWRVLIGVGVLAAIVAGSLMGFRVFVVDQAREGGRAPWFAGYVDATATPQYAFEAPATDAEADVVLSFIVAADEDTCTPTWGAAYTLDEAAQQLDIDRRIARLRQLGGDVLVSFGGATNAELATACDDVDELKDAYEDVVDRYDLATIDLDIEQDDLEDTRAGERRAAAIAALQTERRADDEQLAVWLTLPVLPTGLTDAGLVVLRQMLAAGVDVAGVNIMTMDYGIPLEGRSMGQAAIDALEATHGQLGELYEAAGVDLTDATIWAKLGATPMIGQNDIVDEVFTLADAAQLNAFGQLKELGRLSAWSLNRDTSCSDNYVDTTMVSDRCSGIDQDGVTFASVFADGFDGSPDASADRVTSPGARAAGDPLTPGSPTATADPGEPIVDDPATSPYPIWTVGVTYLTGQKVVWHGNVYEAKWWSLGDVPDDPVATGTETPWTLVGPVLPGEKPYRPLTLPPGTYPEWSGTDVYEKGARVLFDGTPYEAKWWSQGDSPAATAPDPDGSPWLPLTAPQVEEVLASQGDAG